MLFIRGGYALFLYILSKCIFMIVWSEGLPINIGGLRWGEKYRVSILMWRKSRKMRRWILSPPLSILPPRRRTAVLRPPALPGVHRIGVELPPAEGAWIIPGYGGTVRKAPPMANRPRSGHLSLDLIPPELPLQRCCRKNSAMENCMTRLGDKDM